jgi:NDP-4-keto-2,6-dideoxyhexose 3-C-methyltransferase
MSKNYTVINKCRACSSTDYKKILSLGNINVIEFSAEKKESARIPLDLILCNKCHLLQLKQNTNPQLLWNASYGYRSGINDTMRKELKKIVRKAEKISQLKKGDIVIDIGCNDGTLLDYYRLKKIHRVGYDPSHNVISIANKLLEKYGEKTVSLFVDFFAKEPFKKNFDKPAKLITAIAMFYDLDNPNKFLKDVYACLEKNGLFIIQQNYLLGMLKQNAFDNILHEHLEYYSLSSLNYLLNKNGFEVFDVSQNNINGGSFRTYIRKKGTKLKTKFGQKRVERMLEKEKKFGILKSITYTDFSNRIEKIGKELKNFIKNEVKKGKKIYIYGASTRGNTLMNYLKIDNKLIAAAAERNPYKWGKFISGSNIPIISEEQARSDNPDYFLVLPWYFRNEFIEREQEYLKNGGKFIFALPKFEVFSL